MDLVEDLREQIEGGKVLVIAGAWVAIAASGGDRHTAWRGLLESGVAWCEGKVPGLPRTWPGLVRGLLELGDVSSLLSAAEMVTERLGGREGREYRAGCGPRWDRCGRLTARCWRRWASWGCRSRRRTTTA